MKVSHAIALAAYILSSSELVAAAATVKDTHDGAATLPDSSRTFKVQQKANPRFRNYQGRGAIAKAKALAKHGIPIPDDLQKVVDKVIERHRTPIHASTGSDLGDDKGETPALPSLWDIEYLSPVQIGTPPQTLMLDFDTGSSDLWVFSTLVSQQSINGQTIFDINASSTSTKLEGATWSIIYGDGSGATGYVYTDTVSVGGVNVEDQAVEVATHVSGSFSHDPNSDGLLGLGFSSINQVTPVQQKTFFDNAMPGLAEPLFTANLLPGEAGNYNFGFLDPTEYVGPITYIPVDATEGFWMFTATSVSVPSFSANTLGSHTAIMDTGTTLLLVPSSISDFYYNSVPNATNDPNQGGWVFDCATELPNLEIQIGEYTAVIPGELIRFAPADTDDFQTASACFGGIQTSAGLPFAIYGDVFMKSQFVVFHGEREELGFARKARRESSVSGHYV